MAFKLRYIFPQHERHEPLTVASRFVMRPAATYTAPAGLHIEDAATLEALPALKASFADPVSGEEPELSICVFEDCFALPGGVILTRDGSIVAESLSPFMEPGLAEPFKEVLEGSNGAYRVKLEGFKVAKEPLFHLRERGEAGYFHWMHSILPKLGLLSEFSSTNRMRSLCRVIAPFQKQTLDMLQLDQRHLMGIGAEDAMFCPQLYYATPMVRNGDFWRRPRFVSDFLRAFGDHVAPTHSQVPYLYISRQDAGVRKILNEEQIIETLRQRGFYSVELAKLSLADQVTLIKGAKVIVGGHGAGLANISFAPQDCKVIEIISPSRLWPTYRAIAARGGQPYGFVLAEASDDPVNGHFTVDVDKVMRTLDQMLD